MLKTILKTSVTLTCLAWSGLSCAAGLGGINVTSALGQPLKAEIEITAADKTEKTSLRAKLASVDAYKDAGIDYPYGIPKLKFQIEDRDNGEPIIRVTSAQPINDPFLTLMVELSWASGKLVREYTFLLDPVGYKPEQPKAEEVKPVQPLIAEPVAAPVPAPAAASAPAAEPATAETSTGAASAVTTATTASAVAAEGTVAAQSEVAAAPVQGASAVAAVPEAEVPAEQPISEQPLAKASAPAAAPTEAAPAPQEALGKEAASAGTAPKQDHVTVKAGDTLTKIAAQIKPADVSLERMLVALYRENTGVFDGHNMNRVRAGKILNIPSSAAVDALPQADAEEEIHAQAADWNAYRQKLAAAKPVEQKPAEDKQEVSGKISAAVTDKAVPAKEPAKEVLKLSKGEAPGDKAVGNGKASAQEKAIAKEENAIATGKALKETQERTAILEKNVQDLKRLAEVKAESAPAAASSTASAVTLSAASAPKAASSVAAAKPKPKVVMPPPKVVQAPSLMDQLLQSPLYLAGGAAILLGLGGAGFMFMRRRKGAAGKKSEVPAAAKEEEVGASTGRMTAPVSPSPETGDFTHAAAQGAPASEAEEVDPIGEADLFLTFGRDVQAEEVLKEALKKNPNNIPVKLKLLSIYSNRKDVNAFYTYAREIKESGDETAWDQAMTMGRALDPSNPFYGGTAGAVSVPEGPAGAANPAVDFDVFGAPAAPEFGGQNTVVMETPSQEKTTIMSPEELRTAAQQSTTMDFDITGTNPSLASLNMTGGHPAEEAPALNMDDLVFDVTTTHPKVGVPAEPVAEPAPAAGGGLEFTLDFPLESKPAAPAKAAPELGLGDISLDLGGGAAGGGEPKGAQWQEVATKLDLAKAYQEMGDVAGAREILEEVLRDGDEQQRATAQTLMQQL